MTAASTAVKYFHSAMPGAPVLSGTAGTLIAVLDACLKDGFNLKTVDTLVVASGIATANMSTGSGAFEADAVALISGATPNGLNGEKRIISVTANTITFDATGISDQTATGTITAKLASAGWDKPFSGTNLAAYRSAEVTGTRFYLRVDDTGTQNARVVGYETMSDVNTGTGPYPTTAQVSGGFYWPKANAVNATPRAWTVIADSKSFWIHLHTGTTNPGVAGYLAGFGDFTPAKSGDAYCSALYGAISDLSTTSSSQVYSASGSDNNYVSYGVAVTRSYTGLGGSVQPTRRSESYQIGASHSGSSTNVMPYPNSADNSLLLSRMILCEGYSLRGVKRGILFCPQVAYASFNWRDKVDGSGAYAGRKLMAIKGSGNAASTGTDGVTFFDITGPWG